MGTAIIEHWRAAFSAAALTRSGGFTGVDGAYRLLPDGSTDRALAILEVQKFGSAVVEPAPTIVGPPASAAVSSTGFSLFKMLQ